MNISFNKHHNYESSFPHELIQCVVSICILIKGTSTIATDVWFYFIMNKFNVNCQTVLLCEVSFTNMAHKWLFLSMNFYSASLDNFTVLLCSLDNFTVLAQTILQCLFLAQTILQWCQDNFTVLIFQPRQFYCGMIFAQTILQWYIFSIYNFTVMPRQFYTGAQTILHWYIFQPRQFYSLYNFTTSPIIRQVRVSM